MIVQAIHWFCYATAAVTVFGFFLLTMAWLGAVNAEPEAHAPLDTDDIAAVIPIARARCQRVTAPSRCGR